MLWLPRWKLALLAGGMLIVTGCCCIDHTCQVGGSGHAPCIDSSAGTAPTKPGPEQMMLDGAASMGPPSSQPLAPPPVVGRFHPVPTRPVFAPR
jgi:hypothetical protein